MFYYYDNNVKDKGNGTTRYLREMETQVVVIYPYRVVGDHRAEAAWARKADHSVIGWCLGRNFC